MIEQAPFRQLPGETLPPATAFWVKADDGVRLRLAIWRCKDIVPKGGVLLFPGRTEYVENYTPFIRDLTNAGYEVLGIDWRGQGMSDRLQENPRPGHIGDFSDYQRDVIEMVVAASEIDLPKPWHLLAHSMGGCIGLAALFDDLPVETAVFSAPMWGLERRGFPRSLALMICSVMNRAGIGGHAIPGGGKNTTYFIDEPFGDNLLTSNIDEWTRLLQQSAAWQDLTIGGPSYRWVAAALQECARLTALPSPRLPVTIAFGDQEKVVAQSAIRQRAERWEGSRLMEIPNCRHAIMAEMPELRGAFLDAVLKQFDAA